MVKCIDMGLMPIQDPEFGISHTNITKKLTRYNWRNKATVRGSCYLWIVRGSYSIEGKKVYRYFIQCEQKSGLRNREFKYLMDAIHIVNNYAEYEGKYPSEFEQGWTIHIMRKR